MQVDGLQPPSPATASQESYGRVMMQGYLDILSSIFHKKERRKHGKLKASPQTAYMRVSSFLKKLGMNKGMISFSAFEKEVKNESDLRRVTNCINSIDKKLDKFTGELETAGEGIINLWVLFS